MEKIDESRAKAIDKINKEYNRYLRKIANTPIEFKTQKIGEFQSGHGPGSMDSITHLIETKSGEKIASLTVILHYTAYGLVNRVDWEGLTCYCGTLVDKPVPASMLLKNVKEGLRTKPYFLPYVEMKVFSARNLLKTRTEWNPLLDEFNSDDTLRSLLKKLPTEKIIYGIDDRYQAGRNKIWNNRLDDADDNYNTMCQIIPHGNKTFVVMRHVFEDPRHIEHAVKAIIRIKNHVANFDYSKFSIGRAPQQWANDVIDMVNHYMDVTEKESPEATETELPLNSVIEEAEPVEEARPICPRCGAQTSLEMRYCGECGFNLSSNIEISNCPSCGAPTHPGMKYCGRCGASLKY